MSVRIKPSVNPDAQSKKLLEDVKKTLGSTPNFFTTLANSSAALGFYLGGSAALSQTKISAALREEIALTVAGVNTCDYCASAHTAIGKMQKIPELALMQSLVGKSEDKKTEAALQFASKIVELRGLVSNSDLEAVRKAGYSDEEIAEIVAVVCQNIFTNYFNHVAGTEVDFPKVSTELAHQI